MANKILIGSIVHLESIDSNTGGFLNTLGWVTDIPVITKFHDPNVNALVTTYAKESRVDGAGSWQILSADREKRPGEELQSGDKIHLLNMQPGAGYLDTFEWVQNLEPFKKYPVKVGVFTSSPNRGGGVSGTWTIRLSTEDKAGTPIFEDTPIKLENDYPGAGFLCAYMEDSHKIVSQHESKLFKDPEAKKFVFTGFRHEQSDSNPSFAWKMRPTVLKNSLYRIENQWGDDTSAPWHAAGIFKIGDGQKGRIVDLELKRSAQPPEKLDGYVIFEDNPPESSGKAKSDPVTYSVAAALGDQPNSYTATLTTSGEEKTEIWMVGSREFQHVRFLKIQQGEDGRLTGEIQYEGEQPIRLQATPGADDDEEIVYDFFHPDLLKGRTQKMRGVINTTYWLISEAIKALDPKNSQGGQDTSSAADPLKDAQDSLEKVDFDFQKEQLHNLKLLSQKLSAFYTHKLQYLMKQSFKIYQKDQTLAPLHLIRQVFQSLATDYEIIQRATVQRRWTHGLNKEKGYFISEQAMELLIMDKLAIKAIAPFRHLLADKKGLAIISYLSERTHIRHLPYTDQSILIGVSYDRVPQAGSLFDDKPLVQRPFHAFELMAIPHEIGHYIYTQGRLKDGRTFAELCQQFEGNNPYFRWGEELFADLYGCIVTGPLTVLSMRALLVSTNRERVWKDDEHHPTPVLRMFILNEMLRILKDMRPEKYDFTDVTDTLDKDWADILESWGYSKVAQEENSQPGNRPSRIYLHDNSAIHLEQIVNIDRIINAIRPIIIEFATQLLAHYEELQKPAEDLNVDIPWVPASQQGDAAEEIDACNKKMRELTNRESVAKKALFPTKLSIEIDNKKPSMKNPENPAKDYMPDELLRIYLDKWGDSGPTGSSGGTHK